MKTVEVYCHVLTLVFVLFVCLNWSGRELGGHSMFCVSRLVFCVWPSMVLNQRQVSLVVSD